jgi:hypothetical protein
MEEEEEDYLEIHNMKDFVTSSRKTSYKTIAKNLANKEKITGIEQFLLDFFNITKITLENILPDKEVEIIIRKNLLEKTKTSALYFKKNNYRGYAEKLCMRLMYNMLHELAKLDLIEVGFDGETDGFIFWEKQHE